MPKHRPVLFLIELFSGSKSVSRVVRRKFGDDYEVRTLSVDIDPKSEPDIVADINTWKYKPDLGEFLARRRPEDIVSVWLSPPCTHFSFARTTGGPRDLEGAARNVRNGLKIARCCQPTFWFMENPRGLLAKQQWMETFNNKFLNTCSYCRYSSKGFRKDTHIWSNVPGLNLKTCNRETPCPLKKALSFHPFTAQSGSTSRSQGSGPGKNVYGIPKRLVATLFATALGASR